MASGGVFGRGGKVVLVEAKAEVIIGVRRGAIGEETPDSGRSPLELFEEGAEPAG